MTESSSGKDQEPRDQTGTSADPDAPDDEQQSRDDGSAEGQHDEDMSAPPGPAEEKDRQTEDDRGLTTDTSPSD